MNNNSGKVGLPSQLYRCNFGFNEPHQPKSTTEFETETSHLAQVNKHKAIQATSYI